MKKGIVSILFVVAVQSGLIMACQAEEISDKMKQILQSKLVVIKRLAANPIIINSVKNQNEKEVNLERIKAIDTEWKAGGAKTFVINLEKTVASRFLKKKVKSNKLLYTEAFLCDGQGAIVGMYPKTSDYWQGDEEKFTGAFNGGKGKMFIGPVEFDDSTQAKSIQVSVPVEDNENTIGVLVVGFHNIR